MKKRTTFVLVILTCAALAALVFWPRYLVLDVARADSRAPLLCAKMHAGEEVVLTFVHSVNRRPVHDTIRVASDHLVVVKSVFDSFGAGMPEATTGEGTLRVGKDGWLEWTINRPMPEVVVRIGWVADKWNQKHRPPCEAGKTVIDLAVGVEHEIGILSYAVIRLCSQRDGKRAGNPQQRGGGV